MVIGLQETPAGVAERPVVVNNFSINIATINGSGSQTSNGVLLRAMFKMGIPVTGKNLFPSNIQGLPTWYIIRLSKDGYLARRDAYEVMVCLNGRTVAEDMDGVAPGGVVLYDDSLPIATRRHDVTYYPMPVSQLVKEANLPFELKDYIANMVYVGVLAWVLKLDIQQIQAAVDWSFGGKAKAVKLNMDMVDKAYAWAQANLTEPCPYRAEPMTGFNEGKIMVDGNTSGALGAIWGGFTFAAWYPITPASSLAENLTRYAAQYRADPDNGKATFAIIQAEDELAALGMVIGAGWAGARAMTSTSGPGLSLMAEFAGLAYFAEIPAVIWDVQRIGPSTGLPTRTAQGDITEAYHLSHGDTKHVLLFPCCPTECFEFGSLAFDLAERLQTLVIVMSDLDLGMNQWITAPFPYPEKPIDRGKVLTADDLDRLAGQWGRYKDIDGDGIPYRTLPGTPHRAAAYFTRGTGHNEYAGYTEKPDDWERNLNRLSHKFDTARDLVPAPEVDERPGARIGIITFGSNHEAVNEARDLLRQKDIESSYLRLRALPINQAVRDFIEKYDQVFVVENNQNGQVFQILLAEEPCCGMKMVSVHRCNGLSLTADWIVEAIHGQVA
ncbi:MAG TPA: 2-oxoacid:acceptor oxidoreductase subunit alpha [Anaerolineae bacterium]